MIVEITKGQMTVKASVKSEERLLFAMAAAWQAFDAVMSPVIGEAVRYTEDCKTESSSSRHRQSSKDSHQDKQQDS